MFTGIIESTGTISKVLQSGTNKTFWIASPLSASFSVDQSVAHDGICLTVEAIRESSHQVTAVSETLKKTTLGSWCEGREINIEQCLLPASRLDGHLVQGHVDATGKCLKIKNRNGSYEIRFSFPRKFAALVIEKGSVSINGISLTVFNVRKTSFTVAIIPYTWGHTNLRLLKEKNDVNLEFDVIGKYILRLNQLKKD